MYSKIFRVVLLVALMVLTVSPAQMTQAQSVDDFWEHTEYALVQMFWDMEFLTVDEEPTATLVMTLLLKFDSEDMAEEAYEDMKASLEDDEGATFKELKKTGEEAHVGTYESESDGEIVHVATARDNNIMVMSVLVGAPDSPEVPVEIIEHILDKGPSDDDLVFDNDDVAHGEWADAFPEPEDIAGLSHMEPAMVMNFDAE